MNSFFKFFMVVALSAFVMSCTSKEDKAKEVASGFLDAYTSHNYKGALQMCSPQLQEIFVKIEEDFENLPDDYKEILEREVKNLVSEIESASALGKNGDTVLVCYRLINGCDTAKCYLKVVEDKVIALNQ